MEGTAMKDSLVGLRTSLSLAACLAFTSPILAQDVVRQQDLDDKSIEKVFKEPGYSPYAGRNFPTQVYWGNQHMHTAISLDAGVLCTLDDEAAYRFARGEEVITTTGQHAKLSRPMDWLLVSDHAEAYGGMVELRQGNPALLADPTLKGWYEAIQKGGKDAYAAAWQIIKANAENKLP